jgi:hypothetical protein
MCMYVTRCMNSVYAYLLLNLMYVIRCINLTSIIYLFFQKLYPDFVLFYNLNVDYVFYLGVTGGMTSTRLSLLESTVATGGFYPSLLCYHCSNGQDAHHYSYWWLIPTVVCCSSDRKEIVNKCPIKSLTRPRHGGGWRPSLAVGNLADAHLHPCRTPWTGEFACGDQHRPLQQAGTRPRWP